MGVQGSQTLLIAMPQSHYGPSIGRKMNEVVRTVPADTTYFHVTKVMVGRVIDAVNISSLTGLSKLDIPFLPIYRP
jgi:hypothetical protein